MRKSIYLLSGVLALTVAGVALSQDRMRGMGSDMHDRMSEMDADGNGSVEKSEFMAMFDKRFSETDTDNNGITFEEYQAKSEADRLERRAMHDERRAERDAKRDEKRAEKSLEREAKAAEHLKSRFDRLDTDGNGTVTAEEYKAVGEKMFERMDRDKDGILNDRRGRGDRDHKRRGKDRSDKGEPTK